jgi:hypothetical protein
MNGIGIVNIFKVDLYSFLTTEILFCSAPVMEYSAVQDQYSSHPP